MRLLPRLPHLLALAVLILLATPCPGCCPHSETTKPNLVIVLVDTLRADHVGYHGYARATTPNIDAVKKRSVAFMNHYSHSSRTGPAVASIFTGLHPRSHGLLTEWNARGALASAQVTLAEILSRHGYTCSGFVGNFAVSRGLGFAQGFDTYEYIESSGAPDVNRLALSALEERSGPFFFYLHYMEPHSPYEAPEEYRGLFEDSPYEGPITGNHYQLDDIMLGELSPTDRDIRRLETLYDQDIRYLDDEFQSVVDVLESSGTLDNTVFVFVADHGEEFWDHGSVLHGYTLYEEQLRVPLFISAPGFEGEEEIQAITRHVDLLPTLLELLQIEEAVEVQGTSLVPWMRDTKRDEPTGPVYAQASLRAVKTSKGDSYSSHGWKLIRMRLPGYREELYQLLDDPHERRDLAAERPETVERLREEMRQFEEILPVGQAGEALLSEEDIEKLRALGYVN